MLNYLSPRKISDHLSEIIEHSSYKRFLVANRIYNKNLNILEFSYHGLAFALELPLYKKNFDIVVIDRGYRICKAIFNTDNYKTVVCSDLRLDSLRLNIDLVLNFIFSKV